MRLLLLSFFALTVTLLSTPASAEVIRSEDSHAHAPAVVALGEIAILSDAPEEVQTEDVRAAAFSALSTVDLTGLPKQSRAVLSIAIERQPAPNSETDCVATVLVRDARTETLVATIKTRVREGAGRPTKQTQRASMRSAVKTAIAKLPVAIRG